MTLLINIFMHGFKYLELTKCFISVSPEKVRKTKGFLTFSGVIEMEN